MRSGTKRRGDKRFGGPHATRTSGLARMRTLRQIRAYAFGLRELVAASRGMPEEKAEEETEE